MSDVSRVEEVYLAAVAQPDPDARAEYLNAACGPDADLRRRVEVLLAAQPKIGRFLEPAADLNRTGPYQVRTENPESTAAVGDRVGPYKLLEKIGEGGMGEVWVADQLEPIKRRVALKLIKPGMDSRSVLGRFEAERQALAVMDHPNIAKVLDAGTTPDGRPYFVMELVKGTPITEFCDARKLTPKQRLELFVPVCQAIQHAHMKGIIHRDIKPSNVMVELHDDRAVPKVIDFGVAKAIGQQLTEKTIYTGYGALVGTPAYMAPEQASFNALDVDTRADVYALGVLLYELLAGSPPIEKERLKLAALDEVLRIVRDEEPPRPSARLSTSQAKASIAATRGSEPAKLSQLMKGEIDWIVMKALEKDRTRRYDTANGLAADVRRYLNGDAVEACPPTLGYRLRKAYRRNRTAVRVATGFAMALFAILGLVLYGVWLTDRQSRERQHERDLVTSRANDAIVSLLDQAEAALKAGRLPEASTLLSQVDERTDDRTPNELRERYDRIRKDELTIRTLEDIFEERWKIARSDTKLDNSRAKLRYPILFQNYGFAIGTEPPMQTIEKLRRSSISESLETGLAEWFFVDPKYNGLKGLLDALDPNPTRRSVREAVFGEHHERLTELAMKIDASQLTPTYAIGLNGEKVMKEVWKNHPDSFPLALSLSLNSGGEMEKAVPWARVAIALRPNNALFHYQLARAFDLSGQVTFDEAEPNPAIEELERTIQLAPQFARAHSKLAILLHRTTRGGKKQDEVALALAERALSLDDKDSLAHLVICLHYFGKKEYLRAARAAKGIQGDMSDGYDGAYESGVMAVLGPRLVEELLKLGNAYEAYQFLDTWGRGGFSGSAEYKSNEFLNSVKTAALSGTGQGLDAPPVDEQPAIRKRALEWMTKNLKTWKRESNPLPVLAASLIGLNAAASSTVLLNAALLRFGSETASSQQVATNTTMNRWLGDPDLTRIRDAEWLDKLPADEQANWRRLWAEVCTLRDRTAPELAPIPREKKSP